jgi:glycosyltransferase involved in cell wall biosynthesis
MLTSATGPAISVLMSVYNAALYVAEAVESIRAQSFSDFEFIIINDGSSDASERILRSFADRDARVRLISRPNTGLIGALNEGLEIAKCDLVARMDADDVAMPQRLDKQLAYMREHPECLVLGSRVIGIDPYGCTLFESEHKLAHEQIDAELMRGSGWAIVHPAAMFRRQSTLQIGGYREKYKHVEDLDLFLRLAERGKLANLPDFLLKYRQHTESINRTKQSEQAAATTQAVLEAYQRRGLAPPENWRYVPKPHPPRDSQLRTWAWKALKEGHVPVARRHAVAAWRSSPLCVESWRALLCAMRGY